jgi:hypothetical protein
MGSGLFLTDEGRVLDAEFPVSVINEEAKAHLVQLGILAEGQGLTNQIGAALPKCVVDALDERGLATVLADRPVPSGRQDPAVRVPEVAVAQSSLAIVGRQRLPQLLAGRRRAVAEGDANNTARLALQRQPDPHRVLLTPDEGPEFIKLQERAFNERMERLYERLEGLFLSIFATVARAARAVRAIALCESRSRLSCAMSSRFCSRSIALVSSVPYRLQPLQWNFCWPASVRPFLRKSVEPQRRQVTAIMAVPSSADPMTATYHKPSVKTRPLPRPVMSKKEHRQS